MATYQVLKATTWSGVWNDLSITLQFPAGPITPNTQQQFALDYFLVPGGQAQNPYGETGPWARTPAPPAVAAAGSTPLADGAGGLSWVAGGQIRDRGAWQPNTAYLVNDQVVNANIVYLCTTAHTSGATFAGTDWSQRGAQSGAYVQQVAAPSGDTTGATDQTAIAAALAAGGAWQLAAGTYWHKGLTSSVAGTTLIVPAGTTLKLANGQNVSSIHITARATITGDGVIDGNSANQTGGDGGIWIDQADDSAVVGLTVQNTHGAGITVQANRPFLTRNRLLNTGAAGVFVQPPTVNGANLTGGTITGNYVSNAATGPYGIQVHANGTAWIYRLKIANNEVVLPSASASGIGIEIWGGSRKCSVLGNTVSGGSTGISADHSDYASIVGNTIDGPYSIGIEVATTNNATVSGNTLDGGNPVRTQDGISLDGTNSTLVTVTGNALTAFGRHAIYGNGAAEATVTGNTILNGSNSSTPIYFQLSTDCNCSGNVIDGGAGLDCISYESTTGGSVIGNEFRNCTRAGFSLYAGSAFTADRLVIGPNVYASGVPADPVTLLGSVVLGSNVKISRGSDAPAGCAAITVTASPFTYTNNDFVPEAVYIFGGTVSQVAKNAVNLFTATGCTVWLEQGESVTVTYSVAPTMVKDRK